jgi:hypothetical protein
MVEQSTDFKADRIGAGESARYPARRKPGLGGCTAACALSILLIAVGIGIPVTAAAQSIYAVQPRLSWRLVGSPGVAEQTLELRVHVASGEWEKSGTADFTVPASVAARNVQRGALRFTARGDTLYMSVRVLADNQNDIRFKGKLVLRAKYDYAVTLSDNFYIPAMAVQGPIALPIYVREDPSSPNATLVISPTIDARRIADGSKAKLSLTITGWTPRGPLPTELDLGKGSGVRTLEIEIERPPRQLVDYVAGASPGGAVAVALSVNDRRGRVVEFQSEPVVVAPQAASRAPFIATMGALGAAVLLGTGVRAMRKRGASARVAARPSAVATPPASPAPSPPAATAAPAQAPKPKSGASGTTTPPAAAKPAKPAEPAANATPPVAEIRKSDGRDVAATGITRDDKARADATPKPAPELPEKQEKLGAVPVSGAATMDADTGAPESPRPPEDEIPIDPLLLEAVCAAMAVCAAPGGHEAGEDVSAWHRRIIACRDAVNVALTRASRPEEARIVHVISQGFIDRNWKTEGVEIHRGVNLNVGELQLPHCPVCEDALQFHERAQLFLLVEGAQSSNALLLPPFLGEYLAPKYPKCYARLSNHGVEEGFIHGIQRPAILRASVNSQKKLYVVNRRMELDLEI